MKRFFAFFAVLVCSFLLSCSGKGDVRVLKLGHGLDVSHSVHKAMVFMAERVEVESNGKMRIDICPSQQLGSERELLELLQIGSLDITKVSSSVLEGFEPLYKIFSVPFLFQNEEHRFSVYDGEIGRELLDASRFHFYTDLFTACCRDGDRFRSFWDRHDFKPLHWCLHTSGGQCAFCWMRVIKYINHEGHQAADPTIYRNDYLLDDRNLST